MLARFRKDKTPLPSRFTYPISKFMGIDAKSEQSGMPLSYACYAYNIAFRDEKLTAGPGLERGKYADSQGVTRTLPNLTSLAQFFKKMYFYRKYNYQTDTREDKLLVHTLSDRLFVCDFKGSPFTEVTQEANIPEGANLHCVNYHLDGEDVLLMYLSCGGMRVYNGQSFTAYQNAPAAGSVCVHYERAWLTQYKSGNKLWFSDDLNPVDFTPETGKGGYITFPDDGGELLAVISFKDYIYVFREFCIHRLTAYTDPADYKLTRVFVTNNKIYPGSIQATSDKIIFYAQDGFYAFDGYTAVKVYENITPLIESMEHAAVCFFDQKYIVAARMKKEGEEKIGDEALAPYKNNCIITFDQLTGAVGIMRGADAGGFVPVNIENICGVYVSCNNFRGCDIYKLTGDGKLDNVPLKKLWRSPLSNLTGIDKYKILRSVFISCYHAAKLKVTYDEGQSEYDLAATAKPQRVPINKKCDSVALSVYSDEEHFFVSSLQLNFDLMRYYYANK
ncbi:MAG: hypothetical protein ACOYIQ_02530 [Christensenellales bacterium]|jgi:hypothetical protein